jgi:DNA processing protein
MGSQIAACGGYVVSGGASGIDTAAMQGALAAGCNVIGVLGCGVDVIYPRNNRKLFETVVQRGCLISEYPPGEPAHGWHFPIRNRIISGLSAGVLVVEAPEGSGSLITARDALKQDRDIFCVPGKVDDPGFAGSNALLHEGATLVRDGWDVMGQYEFRYPGKVHPMHSAITPECAEEEMPKVAQKPASPRNAGVFGKKSEKITVDNKTQPPYSDIEEILPKLSENQRSIVKLLTREKLVDEIIAETGLSAATVSTELTMLQLQGIITMLPGNRVARK